VLRWRGGSVERVGLGRLVVVPREVLVGEVSCVLVRLATGSDSIPKREGFWSSRPLCRFVMNSMAVVLRLSSYSQVVRCAGSTREECCLVGIDHVWQSHAVGDANVGVRGCSRGRGRSVLAVCFAVYAISITLSLNKLHTSFSS
jgi:hypothetical protein